MLALILVLGLAACGSSGNTEPSGNAGNNSQSSTANNNAEGNSNSENNVPEKTSGNTADVTMVPGVINLIKLDDRDPSVLRGVAIKGVNTGSYDGINGKESSLTDVRCIFELGEWVEFYPDTDKEFALRVWILKHRDDREYYNKAKFSDLDPNFANYCDLHYPEDAENPDETEWGSFYLNKEECEPGYYDFVFTYEGKAIATLLTRFYNENELTVKSDADLEALMHE